jgi:hypothetical protein
MQFSSPTTLCLTGVSQGGKTSYVIKLLQNKHQMFEHPVDRVLYIYAVWNENFSEMEKKNDIQFHQYLPSHDLLEKFISNDNKHLIIVIDDLMQEVINSTEAQSLFVRDSHHKNITVIYITQNIFCKGKFSRTIALNCHYYILFRSPRDVNQIKIFARQTGLNSTLMEAYSDCVSRMYGYLVVDLSPRSENSIKLFTNIFPSETLIGYISK